MKNIKVNKRVWKQLLYIKNNQHFGSHSETLEFLIQKYDSLKKENQSKTVNSLSLEKTNDSIDTEQKLMDIYSFIDRSVWCQNIMGM